MESNKNILIAGGLALAAGLGLYFVFRKKINVQLDYVLGEISDFQRTVVSQANYEAEKFKGYSETSPQTAAIIQQYWRDGLGYDYALEDIVNPQWQSNHYWSAAFTSWIMKIAGAGSTFPYSEKHATYLNIATDNRDNESGNFRAYSTDEVTPNLSDLVCRRRSGSNASYGNVAANDTLHCDIVTYVSDNSIDVVGGNVNNKVEKSVLQLDNNGYLIEPDYFAIIKNNL